MTAGSAPALQGGSARRVPRGGAKRFSSPETQAWLFVVLVCACVLGLTSWRLQQAYDAQVRASEVTTVNLTRSLADHAHAAVHEATVLIAGAAERLQNDGRSDAAMARLHRMLVRFVANSPAISDIVAFTADGDGLAGTLEPLPRVNVADRAYFMFHRDHPGASPLVGSPLRSRADGRWMFTVSKRLDNPDGSFAGVVVALIDCEWFNRFYRNFDVGPHGSIWLINEDAVMLVHQPVIPDMIGKAFEQYPTVSAYREHGPNGIARVISARDGVARLSSFRKVEDYPLVVFVSVGDGDVLRGWRNDAIISSAVALAISALLGVIGWRLVVLFRLRDRKELALRRSERRYRMLADYSTDVIMQLSPEWRHEYVSPACERLLGYHPLELLDGHPQDTTHPEDWPRLAAAIETIQATGRAPPVSYRVRRKDSVYVWIETQGQKLEGEAGFVVSLRDISSRKRVEGLLHEANNHLQRQVMLDGLTCIANRRCFDLTLSKEFRRAGRDGSSLSLLMIDVDHFKAFNDKYGHPAGDRCLRAIAEAVTQELRRPGDFVARYGGEEFAVVLANTDVAGAVTMAERIRGAIQALAIVHAGNPARVATVSIGVASQRPDGNGDGGNALLQRADAALYQAKLRGRNSVSEDTVDTLARHLAAS